MQQELSESAGDGSGRDPFVDAAALTELPEGGQLSIYVGWRRVLLCRVGEQIYAVTDVCPHALQPLFGGKISDRIIRCAKHGACFDLATGRPTNGVADQPLETYQVRVHDGRIQVDIQSTAA